MRGVEQWWPCYSSDHKQATTKTVHQVPSEWGLNIDDPEGLVQEC